MNATNSFYQGERRPPIAYQVTKLIAGREYRYHVEGFRDPKTKRVKQRWTYVGRVKGNALLTVRRRSREDVRARILTAVLNLLDRRDVSHVTIDVIVRSARVSRGTFYRHFSGRTAVLQAAVASVYEQLLEVPLRADEPLVSLESERARLRSWLAALLEAIVRRPGIQRVLLASEKIRKERARQTRANRAIVFQSLVSYLDRLRAAGLVELEDPAALAHGIGCVTAGMVKRLVFDQADAPADALIGGAIELVCRSVFGPGSRREPCERGVRAS